MARATRIRILIAHDDPLISAGLAAVFRRRHEFEVSVSAPRRLLKQKNSKQTRSDVIVADYGSGLKWLCTAGRDGAAVVLLTHFESESKICHALERGVRGYILHGCSLNYLTVALRSVHRGGTVMAPVVTSRVAERMKRRALTRRETDTLRKMILGLSDKSIASLLSLTVGTVKTHVKSILRKLGAHSRTEAVAMAQNLGILND